ncbi:alpha-glucan family phosphorylase [Thiohalomonas denitrificans]|uniref:Starch phosphorylase n=1 Tax=Thiohalomonas denitrificans TaxID=415747 RepID=A0A1G5PZN0_9GAMM|nr:alpha-glucan family phosphorylase [Thiohalomonas denitrificans]SCZ54601.1 starch phosphorylase [Thiohalomonas denitrificans]
MANLHTNPSYLPRPLPPQLAGLAELALDVRWNWNHAADRLWESIDPELWNATGNAWLILESVSHRRLEKLAEDETFRSELERLLATREKYLASSSWFSETHASDELNGVAYLSMEFGLGEALPIYSGGLGILAGDHLKTASDLGVPLIGVGLLYQQGYFRQSLDATGEQIASYPYNDPTLLPVMPLRDVEGEWLRVSIDLPGRELHLRAWQVQAGRNRLYLLDSNHPLNGPADRGITAELYGGSVEMRLQQELVLGIGGWRLLRALAIQCDVLHLNEGHPAFAVLERAADFMRRSGTDFSTALRATAAGNIFTSHTPVDAAFDRFPKELIAQYLEPLTRSLGVELEELLALGRINGPDAHEPFNMAYLALRCSARINGVSQLHGEVSRSIFQPLFPGRPRHEIPIGHVTNGVHMPSWDSAHADRLWTNACGKERWLGAQEGLEAGFRAVDDETLWDFRGRQRQDLIGHLRQRLVRQLRARGQGPALAESLIERLDPNCLTIGFARRFATYKRPDLLLHDPQRLERLLNDSERPVQLVIAGKAHPKDRLGQKMVRRWSDFMHHSRAQGRMVFVEDYAIGLATELVQGVDLWLNTPLRPWEASGTSGMKVLVNGGLNISELDGWWAEAYRPEAGWSIGDGREHDSDPAWDAHEAEQLYSLLENEVVPAFYNRNEQGIPTAWVQRLRESMAHLTPTFSANRMVRQYTEDYYLPAAAEWRRRVDNNGALAEELEAWRHSIKKHWPRLHFGGGGVENDGEHYLFRLQIFLDEIDPDFVAAQLYAVPRSEDEQSVWPLERGQPLPGTVNGFTFHARVPADRPAEHYTPRLVPHHPHARVPLESPLILWRHSSLSAP